MTPRLLPPPVDNILDLIGNTPMLRLRHIGGGEAADIYVKLEFLNPGFSVKDRIGIGMIRRAEEAGLLKAGGTIVEPTAGNTGVGLALAGVQLGYRVILCVPENFSTEKREVMKALGGEVVLTPKDGGMKAAIAKANELAQAIDGAYVPQQFANPFNTESHYETTGPEIWEQMDGRVDGWVAGAGTGGTFTGVAKYLREKNAQVWCAIVEPQGSILKGGEAGPHEV
ncbi:MAG TPA: cysteine synthase family protein, partial [Thermoanaerobaculia bacterium]